MPSREGAHLDSSTWDRLGNSDSTYKGHSPWAGSTPPYDHLQLSPVAKTKFNCICLLTAEEPCIFTTISTPHSEQDDALTGFRQKKKNNCKINEKSRAQTPHGKKVETVYATGSTDCFSTTDQGGLLERAQTALLTHGMNKWSCSTFLRQGEAKCKKYMGTRK